MPHARAFQQINPHRAATSLLRWVNTAMQTAWPSEAMTACRHFGSVSLFCRRRLPQVLLQQRQLKRFCPAQEAQETFKASQLLIQRIEQPKAQQKTQVSGQAQVLKHQQPFPTCDIKLRLQDLVFGQSFTDHMFLVEHVQGQGWGQPVIKPFGHIPLHPAAQTLHYGVCCFEGMKGYLGKDGKPRLFRSITTESSSTLSCNASLPLKLVQVY